MRPQLPALGVLLGAFVCAAAIGGGAATAGLGGSARALPVVSPIASEPDEKSPEGSALLGAAAQGAPGEAWAVRAARASNTPPVADGRAAVYPTGGVGAYRQPIFYRHTDATGWQGVATPLGEDGKPIASFDTLFLSSASITPKGGGVVIAKLPGYPGGAAIVHQPAGDWKIEQPSAGVLAGGRLADAAQYRAPAAAFDAGGETNVLATATGGTQEAVLHFDGSSWTRETINPPGDSPGTVKVIAIDATGADNAWLLAKLDAASGRGVALFRRDTSGAQPEWREVSLAGSLLASADSAPDHVSGLHALEQNTFTSTVGVDPLTVTTAGVWIDGRLDLDGNAEDFTAYFDIGEQRVTATWCDARGVYSPCDRELGASFAKAAGYRSTAWPGGGFGTRVITAALDPDGDLGSNRGTYLSLQGDVFVRESGINDSDRATSALTSASSGWLSVNAELTSRARAANLSAWSVGTRSPFTDLAPQPGKTPGALDSEALAVGGNGAVARYKPGAGWTTEFLLSSTGLVRRPNLRAVAWPEPGRAHVVGDAGEMWLWRGETGLWEKDPGAPLGFNEQLTDIAFNPADPSDGYAVGRNGTILHYGKSWSRVCFATNQPADADCDDDAGQRLPAGVFDYKTRRSITFTRIAFSGGRPLVIGGMRVGDGNLFKPVVLTRSGGRWESETSASELLTRLYGYNSLLALTSVSGLPDGGAMIGGDDVLIERDTAGGEWHGVDQPLPSMRVIASSLFREGGELRAIVSVSRRLADPVFPNDPTVLPTDPSPLLGPLAQSGEGLLLRQTATGWRDVEESGYLSTKGGDIDRPFSPPAIQSILATASGDAWVAGGANGYLTGGGYVGFGDGGSSSARSRISTSYIARYSEVGDVSTSGQATETQIPQSGATVNFVVGANATCEVADCQDYANGAIAPDVQLGNALAQARRMSGLSSGPRFFMYAGGRRPDASTRPATGAQLGRLASLLEQEPALPVFSALAPGDSAGVQADAWKSAFAGFAAPLGSGPAMPGISPIGPAAGAQAQTHYAFDSTGQSGKIRVIVIDNSRGSLSASDPYQHPAVGSQLDWLRDQLREAKAAGIPAVVVGNKDLNQSFRPRINVADDAQQVATLLRDEGASAYFFDRPEENRQYPIPAGEAQRSNTIPSFGTGTLGYRSQNESSDTGSSSFFGNTGMLLAQVDAAHRDPATNRAPVTVRMIPLVASLNIEAIDGTLLRRSRPALFSGLAARPPAGDRWGYNQTPAGSDPYTVFPSPVCRLAACDTRIAPEYTFSSSDPDIADFVAVDPQSSNVRKPLIAANGKPKPDSSSGLLCAYNAGTTTVSVSAGGQTFSRVVTVQSGTAQPPCGTVPLAASRFPSKQPSVQPPPPPPPAAFNPTINIVPPPPAVLPAPLKVVLPTPIEPFIAPPLSTNTIPVIPPPPPPTLARPIPPTGGMARAPEKQCDEEVATEDSQAFAAYRHDDLPNVSYTLAGLLILAACFGAAIPRARRGGDGRRPVPARVSLTPTQNQWRRSR